MNKSESLHCKICNKYYSSKSSLCNHNKRFHKLKSEQSVKYQPSISQNQPKFTKISAKNQSFISYDHNGVKKYCCKFCGHMYNHIQSRWKHEKVCKKAEEDKEIENKKIELEIAKENNIRLKEEAKILQLKLKLQKSEKVDNITLKKLNKMLLERNNRIKNSTITTNSNNNIQNNIVNYQIVGFGKEENIQELLTNQEKRMILNSKLCSLEKLIEIVHCGRYNQFKNIIVTNIKDNYIYKYDENKGVFVLSNKDDVLNSLIDYRMGDLEVIYNEFLEKNKIDERTKKCIEDFINRINYNDEKIVNNGEHETFKQYKINEIKVLLFNNQDKITNDISLLLSTEETPFTLENKIKIMDT